MTTAHLRFSWRAALLAPLPVPVVAALFLAMAPSPSPLWSFLFFLGLGCFFSYGASWGLLLPGLFILSRFTRLTLWRAGLLGMMQGLAVYVPVAWQSYQESGDNSGPPTESFAAYLAGSWTESWMFPAAGLVTAILYWLLAGSSVDTEGR